MTDWLDGFEVLTFPQSRGGDFTEPVTSVCWHCTVGWCAQHAFNVYAAAPMGACPHITAEYAGTDGGRDLTRHIRKRAVQHVPLNRSSYALERGSVVHPCGIQTNRAGVIQIERVGFPTDEVTVDEHRWLGEAVLAPVLRACPLIPPSVFQGLARMTEAEFVEWPRGQFRHANCPCQPQGHHDPPELDLDLILHFALEALDLNQKDDDMPEYILRYLPDLDNQPWLAVYPSGAVRWVGGNEAGYLVGKSVPFVDEVTLPAYEQAKKDAGVGSTTEGT